ncbi:pyridine nucleotide-disulfide oxidoreductase [Helicobacter sp. 12S02232-10]|uniref:FAD-dependent oxidoreductase n=1 Tax=Helicobacter sp. 12S02232-10 TaxID=1476197 RepID=UPI000BA64D10|nr:FAD-dependent oxidoreductase [Helicobacter sp. 12S02232-10]PAF47959.1 pyridine nucleotide-disulfide oxidoreductase [Helicobacter sp. 12S02232-10]
MQEFDIVVIGFGKAGKTLALKSAMMGKKVALIERSEKMYGGTCINIGCIPTKSLIKQSYLARRCNKQSEANYQQSIQKKNQLVEFLRAKNYENLAQNKNITIFNGDASFLDKSTIQIAGKEKQSIKGKKIFINTGADSVMPNIPIDSKRVYTSTTLLDLEELPKEFVIVGGGYIGLEFACMYANFGSKVSILIRSSSLMPKEDEEIERSVQDSFEKMGINLIFNADAKSIKDKVEKACISYEKEGKSFEINADAALIAIGRKAYTKGLDLDKAKIALNSRGEIITDEFLKTNVENIYALGDVKGGRLFTYISLDDFRIVFDSLFGEGKRNTNNRTAVPDVLFLDTPLSHVGLREREAREKGYEIKVAKLPAAAIPRARILENTTGLLQLITDAKTDLILGATLYCEDSSEMINIFSLAINAGLPYQKLRDMIFTHPSMSEAINDLCGLIK